MAARHLYSRSRSTRSRSSKSPSPSPSTSFQDSESDKLDATGGWDNLEWTKIEAVSRFVHHGIADLLLEAEQIIAEGSGAVLINTDEAGTLFVTNFRLLFLSEGSRNIIALGTIPLVTIEKFSKQVMKPPSATRQSDKVSSHRLLQVIGKDLRIIVYGFRPRTKQRRAVFNALLRCTRLVQLWDLYAFTCGPSKYDSVNPKLRLLNEYNRLLGKASYYISGDTFEDEPFSMSNDWWRISGVNFNYAMCPTYPSSLIVPKCISDEEVLQASTFRAKCRLPVISWCHPGTGAVIARSAQPLVGLMMNTRSNADEKLVAALCSRTTDSKGSRRRVYIADARPRKNALANGAMGGGSESSANYFQSEVVFLGIDNIHAMRDSLARLRDYIDTHGTTSSDGMSSFLRDGGWTWGGGSLSSMSASVSSLGETGWLNHIQSILAGSVWIAARVALESSSVLVHCSDGWDRTTQLVALASLLLDPYYRTFAGFQALVEKDWLAFGHPFAYRMGTPPMLGSGNGSVESFRQAPSGSVPSSPMRSSNSFSVSHAGSSSHAQISSNYSPIFLQWIDCVSQLIRLYPFAFEFSLNFLVDFLDCTLSCRFGNFLCNSERERQLSGVHDSCGCLWAYLADLRTSEGSYHAHYNFFYDPLKNEGPLLPPAAALAPIIWPQFHLRWACPSEAETGKISAQCRIMAKKLSDTQKAKELAEMEAKDVTKSMELLTAELQKEKQLSCSAIELAKNACKETAIIKRAVESLGCKVKFSQVGDCTLDIGGGSPPEIERKYSSEKNLDDSMHEEYKSDMHEEDKSDLSVSISVVADDTNPDTPPRRACESFCPLSTRDGGGCKWPNAGCVQLASQFIGLKANFDAFDQLSIYDCYFGS